MATDYLGRELPDNPPTAQTVEDFAVEQGNLQAEDVREQEQTTEQEQPQQ